MAIPLRVLTLEDSLADAEMMLHELRRAGFDPDWRCVETEADYLAHLDSGLDVILADYSQPQFDALRALRRLQERGLDIPFIVVTGILGDEVAADCIKQGASDILLKDRLARLGMAVTQALEQKKLRDKERQAEVALRESEERFRIVADTMPALVWVSGPDGRSTFFNQGWLGFTGRILDQELGCPWTQDIHPDDLDRCLETRSAAYCARQPFSMEYRLRRADGEYRWILNSGIPRFTAAGDFAGFIGSAIDISDRKRVEEQLRLQSAALESAANAVMITDRQGTITWVNPAFTRITGYAAGEALGQNPRILKSGRLDQSFYQALWQTILSGRVWQGEVINRRKDGSIYTEEMTIAPVRDPSGEVANFVAIKQDVTERKRAEEELRYSADVLKQSNKELQQFAYVASHDLQEPLRMVASYTQLLAKRYQGRLDPDADEFIAYAVAGATRMRQLIDDLLTYSQVGTDGSDFAPTDCEETFKIALANLQAAIETSGAIVAHNRLPTVVGDASQLGQVFQNLIGNAIKFHRAQPPRVHVSAMRIGSVEPRNAEIAHVDSQDPRSSHFDRHTSALSDRQSSGWLFSVRDNGIGIDPQYAERIFIIFQRLHNKEEYPGTGMGLAICKKVVERHGGRIWLESEPGKGSTFYFTIPDRGIHLEA